MQTEKNPSTQASSEKPKRQPTPLNGVDTPKLFATINAVKGQPELAKFQFRATNRWRSGTCSETQIESFSGAGGEHRHLTNIGYSADHPAVLCGEDRGPTPVEFLLHALASCLTAGVANIAAARGVTLREIKAEVEGDIDLRGLLGISDSVRNGYERIRVRFDLTGDAPREKLAEILEQSKSRSAVLDVITGRVPVEITLA
jgi:uncharacterized OsmC-like protein